MPISQSIKRSDYLKIRDDLLALIGVTPGEIYLPLSVGFSELDTEFTVVVHPHAGMGYDEIRPRGITANRADDPFAEVAHIMTVRIEGDGSRDVANESPNGPCDLPDLSAALGRQAVALERVAKQLDKLEDKIEDGVRRGARDGARATAASKKAGR